MELVRMDRGRRVTPRPFVPWVGGKRSFMDAIERVLPDRIGRYFEPFLGGGASFFHLSRTGRLQSGAFLSDINEDLVIAFRSVRDEVDEVIPRLINHIDAHDADYFLALRDCPTPRSEPDRAARFIYLTSAAYNGGWRMGSDGKMNNTPDPARSPVIDMENMKAASRALRGAAIGRCDFREALEMPVAGDLVYLDPPYLDEFGRERFRYTSASFRSSEQSCLLELVGALTRRGVYVVLSTPLSTNLSHIPGEFAVIRVEGRSKVPEALMTNFPISASDSPAL